MASIPDCNELLEQYFLPWYSDQDKAARGITVVRPDVMQRTDWVGFSSSRISRLYPEDQLRTIEQFSTTMGNAAVSDLGRLLNLPPSVDFDWIHAVDEYYDTERIAALLQDSDATEDGNPYFIVCIEIASLIGMMMRQLVPTLEWVGESPYWETWLWNSATGHCVTPIDWAIKKLSDYGWDDGLVAKIYLIPELVHSS